MYSWDPGQTFQRGAGPRTPDSPVDLLGPCHVQHYDLWWSSTCQSTNMHYVAKYSVKKWNAGLHQCWPFMHSAVRRGRIVLPSHYVLYSHPASHLFSHPFVSSSVNCCLLSTLCDCRPCTLFYVRGPRYDPRATGSRFFCAVTHGIGYSWPGMRVKFVKYTVDSLLGGIHARLDFDVKLNTFLFTFFVLQMGRIMRGTIPVSVAATLFICMCGR